jgi:outer membrane biosynthesis protein TonB
VVRSTPPGLFDASALAAFGNARFAPGLLGGIAVKSQIVFEVAFAPQARDSAASSRGY